MKKILSLKALTPGVRGPGGYIKDTYLPPISSLICAKPSLEISTQRSFLSLVCGSKTPRAHPFSSFQHYAFMKGFLYNLSLDVMQLMTYFIQALNWLYLPSRRRMLSHFNHNQLTILLVLLDTGYEMKFCMIYL